MIALVRIDRRQSGTFCASLGMKSLADHHQLLGYVMQFARGATIILRETGLQDYELCLGSDGPVAAYLVCLIDQLDYLGLQMTTICVFKENQEDFDCFQSIYYTASFLYSFLGFGATTTCCC